MKLFKDYSNIPDVKVPLILLKCKMNSTEYPRKRLKVVDIFQQVYPPLYFLEEQRMYTSDHILKLSKG